MNLLKTRPFIAALFFVYTLFAGHSLLAQTEVESKTNLTEISDAQAILRSNLLVQEQLHSALRAIEQFSDGSLRFELVGVKTMRAFDANIVVVSVLATLGGGPQQRLLGCHLAEDDPLRSAVVAVLHATNRVLGNFIATR